MSFPITIFLSPVSLSTMIAVLPLDDDDKLQTIND